MNDLIEQAVQQANETAEQWERDRLAEIERRNNPPADDDIPPPKRPEPYGPTAWAVCSTTSRVVNGLRQGSRVYFVALESDDDGLYSLYSAAREKRIELPLSDLVRFEATQVNPMISEHVFTGLYDDIFAAASKFREQTTETITRSIVDDQSDGEIPFSYDGV